MYSFSTIHCHWYSYRYWYIVDSLFGTDLFIIIQYLLITLYSHVTLLHSFVGTSCIPFIHYFYIHACYFVVLFMGNSSFWSHSLFPTLILIDSLPFIVGILIRFHSIYIVVVVVWWYDLSLLPIVEITMPLLPRYIYFCCDCIVDDYQCCWLMIFYIIHCDYYSFIIRLIFSLVIIHCCYSLTIHYLLFHWYIHPCVILILLFVDTLIYSMIVFYLFIVIVGILLFIHLLFIHSFSFHYLHSFIVTFIHLCHHSFDCSIHSWWHCCWLCYSLFYIHSFLLMHCYSLFVIHDYVPHSGVPHCIWYSVVDSVLKLFIDDYLYTLFCMTMLYYVIQYYWWLWSFDKCSLWYIVDHPVIPSFHLLTIHCYSKWPVVDDLFILIHDHCYCPLLMIFIVIVTICIILIHLLLLLHSLLLLSFICYISLHWLLRHSFIDDTFIDLLLFSVVVIWYCSFLFSMMIDHIHWFTFCYCSLLMLFYSFWCIYRYYIL